MTYEIVTMWAAVTLYAAGSIAYTVGTVFLRKAVVRIALWISLAGLIPHTVGIVIRWSRLGHGPYLGFYEVVSSYAWLSVIVLALLTWRYHRLRNVGIIVMPIAFLLLAGAMFAPKSELAITGMLASYWLMIHVTFAKLAYASFIASFAVAVAYLARDRGHSGAFGEMLEKLPDQETLDDLSFRFVGVGFIFLSIMIAAGAIWANEAWGRYWGWDPIETWSLISWLVYAAYLHARLTLGWKGRKSTWFAAAALPVVVFALIGVPLVYKSIHGAYLTGY